MLLALGWLLLAAQQVALQHPLAHLEAPAQDAAEPDCRLCLACAAAVHLAAAAAGVAPASPPCDTRGADIAPAGVVARAPVTGHNRGPPGEA